MPGRDEDDMPSLCSVTQRPRNRYTEINSGKCDYGRPPRPRRQTAFGWTVVKPSSSFCGSSLTGAGELGLGDEESPVGRVVLEDSAFFFSSSLALHPPPAPLVAPTRNFCVGAGAGLSDLGGVAAPVPLAPPPEEATLDLHPPSPFAALETNFGCTGTCFFSDRRASASCSRCR